MSTWVTVNLLGLWQVTVNSRWILWEFIHFMFFVTLRLSPSWRRKIKGTPRLGFHVGGLLPLYPVHFFVSTELCQLIPIMRFMVLADLIQPCLLDTITLRSWSYKKLLCSYISYYYLHASTMQKATNWYYSPIILQEYKVQQTITIKSCSKSKWQVLATLALLHTKKPLEKYTSFLFNHSQLTY
jgi:hypothetical protein